MKTNFLKLLAFYSFPILVFATSISFVWMVGEWVASLISSHLINEWSIIIFLFSLVLLILDWFACLYLANNE